MINPLRSHGRARGPPSFSSSPLLAPAAAEQPLTSEPDANQRQRVVSSSARVFDKLAAVEAQLVLQFLDTPSRLRAARCSRRLAHEVAQPFSWRGASFSVRSDVPGAAERIRASTLLRTVPVHLTLVMPDYQATGDVAETIAFPNIHSLDGSAMYRMHADAAAVTAFWVDLLSRPELQHLHSLTLPAMRRGEQQVMQAVARLSYLHTLRCNGCDEEKADRFAPLASAPALTSLAVSAGTFGRFLRPALAVCTKLRTFEVSGLRAAQLSDLSTEPTMRSLTRLILRGMVPIIEAEEDEDDEEQQQDEAKKEEEKGQLAREYAAAFGNLQCLHTLEVEGLIGIDFLLPHLALASSLRLLVLTTRPLAVAPSLPGEFRHTVPSVPALRALLDAAPHLLVQLHAPQDRDAWDRLSTQRFNRLDEWPAVEAIDHEQLPRVQRRVIDREELETQR